MSSQKQTLLTCDPGTHGDVVLAVHNDGTIGQLQDTSPIICSQLWAYDDLQTLSSQPELSTQLGRKPAAAFCPSCGVFTLDIGSTQVVRDQHVRTCREHGEPEAGGAHSDGEDENEAASGRAAEEDPSSSSVGKRQCIAGKTGPSGPGAAPSTLSGAEGSLRSQGCGQPPGGAIGGHAAQSEASSSHKNCVQVSGWLRQDQLGDHAAAFQRARVTAPLLRHLVDADLQQMGVVAPEPRQRILSAIQNTRGAHQQQSAGTASGAGAPQVNVPPFS